MTLAADPAPDSLHGPPPIHGPEKLTFSEKSRIRAAAHHATKVWPGPVGDLISRELLSWEDFGYRFGAHCPTADLVDHVLKQDRTDRSRP